MTTDVPTEDRASYSDRGWSSMLHPSGPSQVNRGRLHLGVLVQEMTQALAGGYNGIQATARHIHHAVSRTTTPAESVDLESQTPNHANQQQDMGSVVEPGAMPVETLHDQTNSFAREANNPEDASESSTLRDDHSTLAQSKRSWTSVVRLPVTLLLLIMAPGLIVGIVTRQVAWGIDISGAFASSVVFFGGLYYHRNK